MGRLQKALSSIITFYQGAFIQDRQILDGVPIVNECIHSKLKANTPELLCKQDQGNAVDRVEWDLLIYLLCRMGFDLRWRKWIQESISSASFSILINGSPKGYFPAHGDLQQGDHYLFSCLSLSERLLARCLRRQVEPTFSLVSSKLWMPQLSLTSNLQTILSFSVVQMRIRQEISRPPNCAWSCVWIKSQLLQKQVNWCQGRWSSSHTLCQCYGM